LQELYDERSKLVKHLNESIIKKQKLGKIYAKAEQDYKSERTRLMAKMMILGYESESGLTKPIAATAVYNMAQGDKVVAKLKYTRDLAMYEMDVVQENIYALKLQINIIEEDLKNIRRGV
jgi:hypothetical protein